QPMRFSLLRLLAAFAPVVSFAACSETVTKTASPTPDAGQEAGAPTGPDSIPVVALESDPATDCPGKYAGAPPLEGVNEGFASAGQDREFVLILPADTSAPRPLLVGFNGTGETGESFAARAKLQDFADSGFIVLAPSSNGNGTTWPIWDSLRQPGKE